MPQKHTIDLNALRNELVLLKNALYATPGKHNSLDTWYHAVKLINEIDVYASCNYPDLTIEVEIP